MYGETPLTTKPSNQISGWACVALVALRLGIGWHFFAEGVNKLQDPKPFTAGFFGAAKGPLASFYQGRIWDADGRVRLDRDATWNAWDRFREQTVRHYGFDDSQVKRADRTLSAYIDKADAILVDQRDEIATYLRGLARRDQNRRDPAREQVASLKAQSDKIDADLKKDRGPWLGQLDKLWVELERDLNAIATAEQRSRGTVSLPRPSRSFLDTTFLDSIIPYTHIALGLCLFFGLFTRTAAWGAVAFLVSVIATQPPWVTGAAPVYYQIIEALAAMVVATAGAGRHAGFDFLIRALRMKCCPPQAETQL